MKADTCCRVSTDMQAEEEFPILGQENECLSFARGMAGKSSRAARMKAQPGATRASPSSNRQQLTPDEGRRRSSKWLPEGQPRCVECAGPTRLPGTDYSAKHRHPLLARDPSLHGQIRVPQGKRKRGTVACAPLGCELLVAGVGFEPTTSGL